MRRWHVGGIISACIVVSAIGWYLRGIDGLNVVGTLASIAGLGISIYVAIAVGDIRRSYVSHAILTSSLQRLEVYRGNLSLGIKKKDTRKIHENLSGCKGLLSGLRRHLSSDFEIDTVINCVEICVSEAVGETDPRLKECEHKLNSLLERLRTHIMELQWGGHDG